MGWKRSRVVEFSTLLLPSIEKGAPPWLLGNPHSVTVPPWLLGNPHRGLTWFNGIMVDIMDHEGCELGKSFSMSQCYWIAGQHTWNSTNKCKVPRRHTLFSIIPKLHDEILRMSNMCDPHFGIFICIDHPSKTLPSLRWGMMRVYGISLLDMLGMVLCVNKKSGSCQRLLDQLSKNKNGFTENKEERWKTEVNGDWTCKATKKNEISAAKLEIWAAKMDYHFGWEKKTSLGSLGIKPTIFKGLIVLAHTEIGFDWKKKIGHHKIQWSTICINMFPDCIGVTLESLLHFQSKPMGIFHWLNPIVDF